MIAVCSQANAKPHHARPVHAAPAIPGDATAGYEVFKSHCSACHGKQGEGAALAPPLLGVVGARAASSTFTGYTAALKASGAVWTPAKLDAFLSGPAKLIPGTAMMMSLPNGEDRQNLIAYLATLKK
ncbi:MAG: c-type cytochrome [Caulobacteraceae bacterium]